MFFDAVWDKADALYFIKGRLKFYHVDGTQGQSAGAPSVLIAYGNDNAESLRNCPLPGKYIDLGWHTHGGVKCENNVISNRHPVFFTDDRMTTQKLDFESIC